MTTKTATKATKTPAADSELARLMAELDGFRVKNAELEAKLATRATSGKSPKIADWERAANETEMVGAGTLLGDAQRLPRPELLEVTIKALRNIRHREVAAVLADLVARCTDAGGLTGEETAETLIPKLTAKRAYNRKAAEVV